MVKRVSLSPSYIGMWRETRTKFRDDYSIFFMYVKEKEKKGEMTEIKGKIFDNNGLADFSGWESLNRDFLKNTKIYFEKKYLEPKSHVIKGPIRYDGNLEEDLKGTFYIGVWDAEDKRGSFVLAEHSEDVASVTCNENPLASLLLNTEVQILAAKIRRLQEDSPFLPII